MSAQIIPFRPPPRREVVVTPKSVGPLRYWVISVEHADGERDREVPVRVVLDEATAWTFAGIASKAFNVPVRDLDGKRVAP